MVDGDCAPSYLEVWLDPLGAYQLLGLPANELSGQFTDITPAGYQAVMATQEFPGH